MKKSPIITLGQLIAIRREQVGMTQWTLGTSLGYISAQFVSNWERNKAPVPPEKYRRISQLLGIPMREMIDHRCRDVRRELNQKVRLS